MASAECNQTIATRRISHICIPIISNNPKPQWESIYNPMELENNLLQQHCMHFAQAEVTVFTQEPLCSLINNTCTTEFTQQVLAGTAAIDTLPVDEYTKDLLHHLKSKKPSTEVPKHPLETQEIIHRFKIWPEWMTTSLSGWHSGTYKSSAKHFPPPNDKNAPPWTTQPHPMQKWYINTLDIDDGSCHQTHPHLWEVENHMDIIIRKRSWQPTNRLIMYHPSLWGRL